MLQSINQSRKKENRKDFSFREEQKEEEEKIKTVGKLSADSDRVYELQAATPREKRIGDRTESTQLLLPRPAPSSASAPPSPLRSSVCLFPCLILSNGALWCKLLPSPVRAQHPWAGWFLRPRAVSECGRTRGTTSLEPGESCLYRSTNNKCSRMRGRLDSGQCCRRPFRETFCCASYLTAGSRLPACARRGRETQTPRLFHRGCCLTSTAAAPAVVSFRGGSLS